MSVIVEEVIWTIDGELVEEFEVYERWKRGWWGRLVTDKGCLVVQEPTLPAARREMRASRRRIDDYLSGLERED